ncbi:RAMP superfamily CRISPR-associated protein [Vibrio metschnikovii]|uniref:RAMP superfamily CRISPR-associated protein n=1 Tax=Vibrio metschnikovii TaxID=28172 RepID=UPI001C2FEF24|nr:RAMP superfamily CRISPR-associated protein [Vibrio metschnikovii]
MKRLWLARLLFETRSPLAIHSGHRDTGFDQQLVRDANGLPYIPATSFVGVWRQKASQQLGTSHTLGQSIADYWFGTTDNQSAQLSVHHGLLLNSQGKPVQGLMTAEEIHQDPLLSRLYQTNPLHRERVRINDRGCAADKGKFDTVLLPRGLRFIVDIRWMQCDESPDLEAQWHALLALLANPAFALGASTRNGLGKLGLVSSEVTPLTLQGQPQAGAQMLRFAQRDTLPQGQALPPSEATPFARLGVTALGGWRAGSGARPVGNDSTEHTDTFTFTESAVQWQNQHATWCDKPQAVLCGSSIKGILAHRTAYHLRRLNGDFAEQLSETDSKSWESRPAALAELFGSEDSNTPMAGRLIVDDCVISQPVTLHRTHTSIDRFTGGVRQSRLFSEEILWQPEITLTLHVLPGERLSPQVQQAFEETLNDLKEGLLPLGAASGRGLSLVMHQPHQPWDIDFAQLTGSSKE